MKNENDGGVCIDAKPNGRNLIAELEEKIERYARVSHYVLLTGERGTGKTTIAKKLHELSPRAENPFVNLNCASLTEELLESELFGYEKGAFTGANQAKAGLFETASGGTLFLDEIGELSPNLQAKLLKAVEEKRIRRVGSATEREVDARVIAATSQNLKQMTADGRFRADLYDRLNILGIETVPLRHQKEKIRDLFLQQLETERAAVGREAAFEIESEVFIELEKCDWHGNFRELLNFSTRLAVECASDCLITAEKIRRILRERYHEPSFVGSAKNADGEPPVRMENGFITITLDPRLDDLDDIYIKAAAPVIQHVLTQHNGNLRRSASKLGVNHMTLIRILKKYQEMYAPEDFCSQSTVPDEAFLSVASSAVM